MDKTPYFITTAIYYANGNLHIGHCYEIVLADAMARYKRLRGFDVQFLSGMDEHGQKVERTAAELGVSPQEFVDGIDAQTQALFRDTLSVDYDMFIRTTDEKHKAAVKKIFNKLYEKGDIYLNEYEGPYCVPCESFYTDTQLVDGKCPDCERDVEIVKESAYFFRLSAYDDRLLAHMEANPDFIVPHFRRDEMINNFIKPGLEDLCVSRTSFKWGVPVEFDPEHVVYVWVDALTNYINALDYLADDKQEMYKKYWPADVQLVGKDIVRFHTIIWPALLMALGEPLPKSVYGHGFFNITGKKMGKSFGNGADPEMLVGRYGVDAVRYYVLREITFGQDANFSNEGLIVRINTDLANDLGNLLSRTVGMVEKYFGGTLPVAQAATEFDDELIGIAKAAGKKVEEHFDKMQFSDGLNEIWNIVRRANKYIDEVAPWQLFKEINEGNNAEALAGCLYVLAECLRIVAVLIEPVMPNTPAAIFAQLGITDDAVKTWDSAAQFGLLAREVAVCKGDVVFPRIDVKKELEELAGE